MSEIFQQIELLTGMSRATQLKLLGSLMILALALGLFILIAYLLNRFNENRAQNRYLKKVVRYFLAFGSLALLLRTWSTVSAYELIRWIEMLVGIQPETQINIFNSLAVIGFLWFFRKVLLKLFFRFGSQSVQSNYRNRNMITYGITILALLLVGRIWLQGFTSIATYLGLLSAGLAIALKEPLVNLAGWLFLIFRRPFEVGDRIQIGEQAGDVIDIRIFQFTLNEIGNWVDADQSTGRIIHVPNAHVFSHTQANYTKGFSYIWVEIPVLVTFESDWKKAKLILENIITPHAAELSKNAEKKLQKATGKYMLLYSKLTPRVYTNVKDSGVLLTIRYLCNPRRKRDSQEHIWEAILNQFDQHKNIDFAYPTLRYYDNRQEGKMAE